MKTYKNTRARKLCGSFAEAGCGSEKKYVFLHGRGSWRKLRGSVFAEVFFLSFCSNFVFHDLFPKNNLIFRIFATTATTTTTNEDDDGAKTVVGISPPTTA